LDCPISANHKVIFKLVDLVASAKVRCIY